MRLAVFEDSAYRLDGDELTTRRAFPLFLWGLASDVEALVVASRLDPMPGRDHIAVPRPANATFVGLPHYSSLLDVAGVVRAAPRTARALWRVAGDVDAMWINGPGPVAVLAALIGVARRRRVVLGVRQDTLEYARRRHPGRRGPKLAFRALDAAWRGLARQLPVTLVGRDLYESYSRAPRRHELAVSFVAERDVVTAGAATSDADETVLLAVGRLEEEKNPLLLADVLAALGPGHRLRIVGEGPLEDPLRDRLRRLGVARRADMIGYVSHADGLFDLYRSSDLFLHVSWTEGLPQVLLEAFAARLPVVATDVGGVGAVARGAATLIAPGDAEAAADAVRRVVGDPQRRAQLVDAATQRVLGHTTEAERRRLVAFIERPGPRPARRAGSRA